MTQRKWLLLWDKEYFCFLQMYDSKNKMIAFGTYDSKNWTFFRDKMTLRIEPLSKKKDQRIKELSPFLFDVTQWIELFFANSQNGTLFEKWLTPRIQPFWTFSYDSENWTEPFFCQHDSNWNFLIRLKELNPFLIELNLFSVCLIELNLFSIWLKELNLFSIWLKELNLRMYDSMNWTPLKRYALKHWTSFSIWLKALNLFFNLIQSIEPLFQFDSKHWTPRFNMTQRIEFSKVSFKELNFLVYMTQRIELSFLTWLQ